MQAHKPTLGELGFISMLALLLVTVIFRQYYRSPEDRLAGFWTSPTRDWIAISEDKTFASGSISADSVYLEGKWTLDSRKVSLLTARSWTAVDKKGGGTSTIELGSRPKIELEVSQDGNHLTGVVNSSVITYRK